MNELQDRLLLRIPEAARRLGLGRSTVYELIQAGALPAVRIGKAVRIPASRLEAWVESKRKLPKVSWVVASPNVSPQETLPGLEGPPATWADSAAPHFGRDLLPHHAALPGAWGIAPGVARRTRLPHRLSGRPT